ncbi:MAG: universal stress protein [Phycicoccus sp.]|nr:universal stress protein [Phycicoccus sp.]
MRFVVGYLRDRRGEEAVRLATTMAGAREAHLDIVVVLPSDEPTYDMYSPDRAYQAALEEQAQGWLDHALALVPPGISATGRIRHDDSITEGLMACATDPDLGTQAEAIIVGASSSGLLGQLRIGSVAGALLHASSVPVALAPSGYEASPSITRITAALGQGPGAQALLKTAIEAAAVRGIALRLMSLVALDDSADGDSKAAHLQRAEAHRDALVEQAQAALPAGANVTGVIGTGRSLEDCVTSLDFEPSELVLLGSGRLAPPHRVFLSASAHRISRALPAPMVVVPRDDDPTG